MLIRGSGQVEREGMRIEKGERRWTGRKEESDGERRDVEVGRRAT